MELLHCGHLSNIGLLIEDRFMKAFIRKITSNKLAFNSAIVFAGSMTANVGSYVYHLLMGRWLGPAGYGEFSSLLSLLYIFTVPLLVGQTVLVKFISGFKAHGEVGQAKTLFVGVTKLFVIVSLMGIPIILVAAPWITSFLHLSSVTLFVMVYILFVISLLTTVTASMVQGYQRFIWFSVLTAGIILSKVILTIPLLRWGLLGAFVAAIIASAVMYLLYFLPLRFILRVKQKPTKLTRQDALGFAVPTLFTLLGITSMFSTDIILVRHFFAAGEAGLYAALAILGKIIFYASSAITFVLFPVLSERTAKGEGTKKLVFSAVGAVAGISSLLTLLYFLFPDLIVRLLFGNAYAGAGIMLGMFGVFIALFSIGNIISSVCLATEKTGVWIVPALCAIVQIIAIAMFHGSIGAILLLNIAIGTVFALGTMGYYFAKNK